MCLNLSSIKKMPDLVTDGIRTMWFALRNIDHYESIVGEYWVPVKEYPSILEVSSFMRVRNIKTGKILKHSLNSDGYWYVRFSVNGLRKNRLVHRLYGIGFMQNPNNKPYINHKNLIKSDNIPLNLEWATEKENTLHAKINGAIRTGTSIKHSKLTEQQVIDIYNSTKTSSEIQKEFKITKRMVYKIKSGISWVSVTGGIPNLKSNHYPNNKVIEVYNYNGTPTETSKILGIPLSVVCRIKNKQSYKNILNGLD